jgi:ATP-binding protein involved in chromosome partitioning
MFKKLNIPIAGVVENMSGFICPDTNKEFDIFGKGTAKVVAEEFDTTILAEIPIEPSIREGGDDGKPIVYFHPESQSAKRYMHASQELWSFIEANTADNASIQPTNSGGCSTH